MGPPRGPSHPRCDHRSESPPARHSTALLQAVRGRWPAIRVPTPLPDLGARQLRSRRHMDTHRVRQPPQQRCPGHLGLQRRRQASTRIRTTPGRRCRALKPIGQQHWKHRCSDRQGGSAAQAVADQSGQGCPLLLSKAGPFSGSRSASRIRSTADRPVPVRAQGIVNFRTKPKIPRTTVQFSSAAVDEESKTT
jgi:hypothetical protein